MKMRIVGIITVVATLSLLSTNVLKADDEVEFVTRADVEKEWPGPFHYRLLSPDQEKRLQLYQMLNLRPNALNELLASASQPRASHYPLNSNKEFSLENILGLRAESSHAEQGGYPRLVLGRDGDFYVAGNGWRTASQKDERGLGSDTRYYLRSGEYTLGTPWRSMSAAIKDEIDYPFADAKAYKKDPTAFAGVLFADPNSKRIGRVFVNKRNPDPGSPEFVYPINNLVTKILFDGHYPELIRREIEQSGGLEDRIYDVVAVQKGPSAEIAPFDWQYRGNRGVAIKVRKGEKFNASGWPNFCLAVYGMDAMAAAVLSCNYQTVAMLKEMGGNLQQSYRTWKCEPASAYTATGDEPNVLTLEQIARYRAEVARNHWESVPNKKDSSVDGEYQMYRDCDETAKELLRVSGNLVAEQQTEILQQRRGKRINSGLDKLFGAVGGTRSEDISAPSAHAGDAAAGGSVSVNNQPKRPTATMEPDKSSDVRRPMFPAPRSLEDVKREQEEAAERARIEAEQEEVHRHIQEQLDSDRRQEERKEKIKKGLDNLGF